MFKTYFVIPSLYLILVVLGFAMQVYLPFITNVLAMFPREMDYLPGIVTTVFLHSDLEHLASNILPLSACLFGLFFFYSEIAAKITVLCHVLTGVLIWLFARPAFHIGASGLVYALVFFILTSGFIRDNRKLLVLAFAILVFQSGLIWGLFPQGNQISWESHLMGAIVGVLLSFLFRRQGPQPDRPVVWEEPAEDEHDEYENL